MTNSSQPEVELFGPRKRRFQVRTAIHRAVLFAIPNSPIENGENEEVAGLWSSQMLYFVSGCTDVAELFFWVKVTLPAKDPKMTEKPSEIFADFIWLQNIASLYAHMASLRG